MNLDINVVLKFTARMWEDYHGKFFAECNELYDCVVEGDTQTKVTRRMEQAIEARIKKMIVKEHT